MATAERKTLVRKLSIRESAIKAGYRSGLEESIGEQLKELNVDYGYEAVRIPYYSPAMPHKYTPDFILPNGIIIESKGLFTPDDRKKHELVKAQNPSLDIRFVFSNSRQRITKLSKTTYGMWCAARGFLYADKLIPLTWINETT
jgi:hypothetical protein